MSERRAAENVRHGALRTLPVRRRSAYTDVVTGDFDVSEYAVGGAW